MSIHKKIIACSLFLLSSQICAAQLYVIVECATDPNNGKYSYSDPNTGKSIQTNSCGEALAEVPLNYKLEAHDVSNPAIGGSNPVLTKNGYVSYLFKQT